MGAIIRKPIIIDTVYNTIGSDDFYQGLFCSLIISPIFFFVSFNKMALRSCLFRFSPQFFFCVCVSGGRWYEKDAGSRIPSCSVGIHIISFAQLGFIRWKRSRLDEPFLKILNGGGETELRFFTHVGRRKFGI